MAILNYTTSIAAEKTASEIQSKLVKANACAAAVAYAERNRVMWPGEFV